MYIFEEIVIEERKKERSDSVKERGGASMAQSVSARPWCKRP